MSPGREYINAMLADMREEWERDKPLRRARAVVAFQPDTQDRPAIPDEDGWAALHTLVAAAFGDGRAIRASIPARDDDTDLVAGRWVRQLVEARDGAAPYSPTAPNTWTRAQLVAEVEARMGLRAPEGWEWDAGARAWQTTDRRRASRVLDSGHWRSWTADVKLREGSAPTLIGPDGAFAAAEKAAGVARG